MKLSDKNDVAQIFSNNLLIEHSISDKLNPYDIDRFLVNIHELRNILAHNNKLLGYMCKNNPPHCSTLHGNYGILPTEQRQDVFNIIVLMRIFLTANQYAILNNTIRKRAKTLRHSLHSISIEPIMLSLGFGNNWETITCLPQGNGFDI
jgi:abortive infection bacteriophage resistance protein